jgi:MFS family permease
MTAAGAGDGAGGILWQHGDFVKLWTATTVSVFGSLVTRTALPFAAILALNATPWQLGVLSASEIGAQVLTGLVAGVWADRVRRRPIMIAADIGRALVLASIPLAAALQALRIEHLYVAAFIGGAFTEFFKVADESYLPTLIPRDRLLEGNSKLQASSAVSEVGAFGVSGWLVQWLTAPIALLVDAVSFVVSAIFIGLIRAPEPAPAAAMARLPLWREIAHGGRVVLGTPPLRALAISEILAHASFSIFSAVFLLYTTRELGVPPGIQGMIFAVGGGASLAGALLVGPLSRRFGVGRAMIWGVAAMACAMLLPPLARGPVTLAIVMLVLQQLGDGAFTVYAINERSLRQTITPAAVLGRANATVRVSVLSAMLIASLFGGWLGGFIGLRGTLVVAAVGVMAAAVWLAASPIGHQRR